MAELSAIITSARYDIRDTVETYEHPDAEMVEYANRAFRVLAHTLMKLHSDWVHGTDTSSTLALAGTSITAPTGCVKIRSMWRATNIEIEDRSLDFIMYEQKHNSAGPPDFYAHSGASIEFNRAADQEYTDIVIHYDTGATTLATASAMPYGDRFNDAIREAMVVYCKRRDENGLTVDAAIAGMFEQIVMEEALLRTMTKKRVKLDF